MYTGDTIDGRIRIPNEIRNRIDVQSRGKLMIETEGNRIIIVNATLAAWRTARKAFQDDIRDENSDNNGDKSGDENWVYKLLENGKGVRGK